MRNIVVVDSGCGRVGSSALMGLLKLSGISLGGTRKSFPKPDRFNKRGYFELLEIKRFLERTFPSYLPGVTFPTVAECCHTANANYTDFMELFGRLFSGGGPIAIKSNKCFVLPFISILTEGKNTPVCSLRLIRNRQDQIRSIQRMWGANKKEILRRGWKLDTKFILDSCRRYDAFSKGIYSALPNIRTMTVSFSDLMQHPVSCANKVFHFIRHPKPTNKAICNWIDKGLITF